MGNRLAENCCIKCGMPLIELVPNAWHMCTKCTERTKKLVYDAVLDRKKNIENKPRRILKVGSLKKK